VTLYNHINEKISFSGIAWQTHCEVLLSGVAKYRDFLLWAVWKWLNRSRCSLGC